MSEKPKQSNKTAPDEKPKQSNKPTPDEKPDVEEKPSSHVRTETERTEASETLIRRNYDYGAQEATKAAQVVSKQTHAFGSFARKALSEVAVKNVLPSNSHSDEVMEAAAGYTGESILKTRNNVHMARSMHARHKTKQAQRKPKRPARPRPPAPQKEKKNILKALQDLKNQEKARAEFAKKYLSPAALKRGAKNLGKRAAKKAARLITKGIARLLGKFIALIGSLASALIGLLGLFSIPLLLVVVLFIGAFGIYGQQGAKGLPDWITNDMVITVLECQEKYNVPAGATLAQMIVETGIDGGNNYLAKYEHNLFGIKWSESFSGDPGVVGPGKSVKTQENYGGQNVTIMDTFTHFVSNSACIEFRAARFLQLPRYRDNPLCKKGAAEHNSALYIQGMKDAGYATASDYVQVLTGIMNQYNLQRFDTMTVQDFLNETTASNHVSGTLLDDPTLTAKQRRVLQACDAVGSPGAGLCAAWVNRVFSYAGIGEVYGNANDLYYRYCTSSNKADLKVGMIIAVPSHPHTPAGRIYGHVGIYVGGGMVMDNIGWIRKISLDEWINYYGATTTPKWGWEKGTKLS